MEWWEDIYNRQIYFDLYEEEDTKLAEKEVQQVLTSYKRHRATFGI